MHVDSTEFKLHFVHGHFSAHLPFICVPWHLGYYHYNYFVIRRKSYLSAICLYIQKHCLHIFA